MKDSAPVIFWDFHGTLSPGGWDWAETFQDILEMHAPNICRSQQEINDCLQEGFPWHTPDQEHLHITTADEWWSEYFGAFARGLNRLGLESNQSIKLAGLVRTSYIAKGRFQAFSDTLPTLEHFRDSGWRLAVLSNHVPELEKILTDLNLSGLFENIFTSALCGFEKPRIEFFEHALQSMGFPQRCWMIGDDPIADIWGANNAGIPAVLARRDGPSMLKVSRLDKLPTVLTEANRIRAVAAL